MPWVKKFGCVFLGFFSFFVFGLCHVQGKGREGRARGRQTKTGRKLKNRKQQKEKRLIQRPREGKWQGNVPRPPRPWARARHGRQERPASPKDRAATANAALRSAGRGTGVREIGVARLASSWYVRILKMCSSQTDVAMRKEDWHESRKLIIRKPPQNEMRLVKNEIPFSYTAL